MTRIWVPKVKIIEPKKELVVTFGVAGFFHVEACNRYGTPLRSRAWKQLITDQGLNYIGNPPSLFLARCAVGIGTTAPQTSDTQLENQIAVSGAPSTSSSVAPEPPPYFVRAQNVYEFPLGTFDNDNLTEVGVGPTGTPIAVFSRDLIRDEEGEPTTFPVSADEILRVTHIVQVNLPVDVEADVTITGSGTHDTLFRPANASNASVWRGLTGAGATVFSGTMRAYETDVLSVPTGTGPSGSSVVSSSASSETYTPGNFYREWTANWGLTTANFETGIGSMSWAILAFTNSTTQVTCQMAFDPKIEKFAGSQQRVFQITGRTSWARA